MTNDQGLALLAYAAISALFSGCIWYAYASPRLEKASISKFRRIIYSVTVVVAQIAIITVVDFTVMSLGLGVIVIANVLAFVAKAFLILTVVCIVYRTTYWESFVAWIVASFAGVIVFALLFALGLSLTVLAYITGGVLVLIPLSVVGVPILSTLIAWVMRLTSHRSAKHTPTLRNLVTPVAGLPTLISGAIAAQLSLGTLLFASILEFPSTWEMTRLPLQAGAFATLLAAGVYLALERDARRRMPATFHRRFNLVGAPLSSLFRRNVRTLRNIAIVSFTMVVVLAMIALRLVSNV